jgi:hypothetical protein
MRANATQAQAQDVVNAIQTRLSGLPKTDYVFAHQTQSDLVHAAFNIIGDTSLPPAAKISLTVGREAYDTLQGEYNALLDEQAKVAAETTLDVGFRMSADSAFVQQQFEQLYDNANSSSARATTINNALGSKVGAPTNATIDSILQANPSFQQFNTVQYIKSHMLTSGQFQDGLANVRNEFSAMLTDLKAKVSDDVMPLLQSMNRTELVTYATLQDFIAATAERGRLQQAAEQKRQAYDLQLQASQSGVYLLSTFTGLLDPKLGKTLSVVGTTAIQINQALTNFNVAASTVDTSLIGSKFTGAQLGSVVLAGNLVGAAMQIASLFQNNSSPDQIILDQITQLRQQIAQLQTIIVDRFDRIDGQLNQISGSLDNVLRQLTLIGTDLVQVQTQLFSLQSQVSRLELEIHDWLRNSDRIPLLTGINTALGYEQRNGRKMSLAEFLNYEGLFYTWATVVVKDTTRAGPDYANDIVAANQLKFPLSSNINYLVQMVSQLFGFPRLVPTGTRLVSLNDYLFSASAYYRLILENPDYVNQLPGAIGRLKDVASAGRQLKTVLDAMANKDLFLDSSKGLVAQYQQKRDALKTAIASYRDNTFLPANTCGSSSFDGCIPPGVDFWWSSSQSTTHRPSISVLNGCDGAQYGLALPGNDIWYALPTALLDADRKLGNQLSLCYQAVFGANCPNGVLRQDRILRVSFRGVEVLAMKVVQTYSGCPAVIRIPTQEPEWTSNIKPLFENHNNISVSFSSPWAQNVDNTLSAKRSQYYSGVAQEFTKDSPVGRAATDLNVAKTLLASFIELATPRTLQGNDYLRSLLYGNQQLYLGLDTTNGRDVKSFYTSAGSTTPELDVTPATDKRLNGVSAVMNELFGQITAGQFRETNLQLENMISKLDDIVSVAEAAPPSCSFTATPTSLSIAASGGNLSFSIATDSACSWSISGLSARKGDSLNAAGKDITTSPSSGRVRIAVAGLNQKTISSGTVFILTFTLNASFPPNGRTTVSTTNIQLADAQGQTLNATGGSGSVTVFPAVRRGLSPRSDKRVLVRATDSHVRSHANGSDWERQSARRGEGRDFGGNVRSERNHCEHRDGGEIFHH